MKNQTSIFDVLADQKANELVAALNDGRSKKELYFLLPVALQKEDKIIITAINAKGEKLFNVITDSGEMPQDECVCWRSAYHIVREFGLKTEKQ